MQKVRDHCHYTGKYRGAAHSKCNLNYATTKTIPVVFHNGSTYDYHSIIEQLAIEFKGNFECLGENTEKYITFSVPIKKCLIMIMIKIKIMIAITKVIMILKRRKAKVKRLKQSHTDQNLRIVADSCKIHYQIL